LEKVHICVCVCVCDEHPEISMKPEQD
jgi:hypothetical protein